MIASLSSCLREARAAASPLDAAAAIAELKTLLIDLERSGSGQDDPVVFRLLRSDWEQLVDEVMMKFRFRMIQLMSGFAFVLMLIVVVGLWL